MPVVGVCEDEPALRSVLTRALRAMGHDPLVVATAAEALRAFARQRPAVMILDLCLALRASGVEAPVLFLTARDGLHDKIAGFEAGGDDYLTKPFDLDEVRVRLDALLRRTPAPAAADPGGAVLDPARHALVLDEAEVSLTPTEFRLLGRLMAEPTTVVDSYVRRIRKKLEPLDLAAISTVRGVGYRWR